MAEIALNGGDGVAIDQGVEEPYNGGGGLLTAEPSGGDETADQEDLQLLLDSFLHGDDQNDDFQQLLDKFLNTNSYGDENQDFQQLPESFLNPAFSFNDDPSSVDHFALQGSARRRVRLIIRNITGIENAYFSFTDFNLHGDDKLTGVSAYGGGGGRSPLGNGSDGGGMGVVDRRFEQDMGGGGGGGGGAGDMSQQISVRSLAFDGNGGGEVVVGKPELERGGGGGGDREDVIVVEGVDLVVIGWWEKWWWILDLWKIP